MLTILALKKLKTYAHILPRECSLNKYKKHFKIQTFETLIVFHISFSSHEKRSVHIM